MSITSQSPAAEKVLSQLASKLGPSTDLSFSGACLRISYNWEGTDLASLFADLGAQIEANLELPSLTPSRTELVLMGEVESMRFNANSRVTSAGVRRLEVSIYPQLSGADTEAHRLDSIHRLADSLFASASDGDPNRGLVSYIARRLNDSTDRSAVKLLAAELASVLADHLAGLVDPTGEDVMQLIAASRG